MPNASAKLSAKATATTSTASTETSERPKEETLVHTRILRLALGVDDSRAYWANLDTTVPPGSRAIQAFEQRWFGTKSLKRVRTLLAAFSTRYDAYPDALDVLCRWRDMDPATRQVICHWHLQLSDPTYRLFTGEFLVQRRALLKPEFDRDVVYRWVNATYPERWAPATSLQFTRKLITAAAEAGLLTQNKDQRKPLNRKVPDLALEYLLYLLRGVSFTGTLADNPYLASVGVDGAFLTQRLTNLPSITHRRLADVDDFGWKYPSLKTWAEAML